MKVVAKKVFAKMIQGVALFILALSIATPDAYAFTCPTLQKSKGGADLLVIRNMTLRRDLSAPENQLGIQNRGIVEEQSVGYATIPERGVAQLVIQDEKKLYAISILTSDTWVTTTDKNWVVVDHSGSVSCGTLGDSSPSINSSILNQHNLQIATNTVKITSSNSVLKAFGL